MPESLVIQYQPKVVSAADVGTVYLQQKEWDVYEGKMSNSSMVGAIANLLYGGSSSAPVVYDENGEVLEGYETVYNEDGEPYKPSELEYDSNGVPLYAKKIITGQSLISGTSYGSTGGGRVGRAYVYDSSGTKKDSPDIITDDDGNIIGGAALTAASDLGSNNTAFSGTNPTGIDCENLIEGEMKARVYAYPSPGNLYFSLHVSHGSLSSTATVTRNFRDLIQVRLNEPDHPLSPEYPVYSIIDYDWLGDCYDEEGGIVTPPPVISNGYELFVTRKVYGTLDISYRVKRREIELTIPARDGVQGKSAFHTVVYATFRGGVTWLEVDPSPVVDAESYQFY